jgi:hypothetical protein
MENLLEKRISTAQHRFHPTPLCGLLAEVLCAFRYFSVEGNFHTVAARAKPTFERRRRTIKV